MHGGKVSEEIDWRGVQPVLSKFVVKRHINHKCYTGRYTASKHATSVTYLNMTFSLRKYV